MCNKLYKHEMLSYLRKWLPIEIIILCVALLGRFVQFFEADATAYDVIFGSTMFFYGTAIIVSFVLTFVVCIKRFHNNLFTGEGYLTFTLPVTPVQHILIKACAAVTVTISTLIIAVLSVFVLTAGEVAAEIFKAAAYILKEFFEACNAHAILYIAEFLILLILSVFSGMLLIYACIALGQTFNRSRVGWAVAIYFIYYFIGRIITTILTTVLSLSYDSIPFEKIARFIRQNPFGSVHIFFGISILFTLIGCVIFYLITHFVIKKKLNLE